MLRIGRFETKKNWFGLGNWQIRRTQLGHDRSLSFHKSSPVLDVPLEKCVPCLLHAVMNLTRLLWNRLISEAISNDAFGLLIINIVETKLKLKVQTPTARTICVF